MTATDCMFLIYFFCLENVVPVKTLCVLRRFINTHHVKSKTETGKTRKSLDGELRIALRVSAEDIQGADFCI